MVKKASGLWFGISTVLVVVSMNINCSAPTNSSSGGSTTTTSSGPYIYISSGNIYGGSGVITASASNTIVRYTINGTFDRIVWDYTSYIGDSPVNIINYNSTYLLALIDNPSGRRVDLVAKDGTSIQTFLSNGSALNNTVRSIASTTDGGLLISKTSAVEKFSSTNSRITISGNPYINAPASGCATSTNLISKAIQLSTGYILMVHASASPNNQINVISSNGYATTADCLGVREGETLNSSPTAVLYHSTEGKLLVSYSNSTSNINTVYSYTVNGASFASPTLAYSNNSVLNGISDIAEMTDGSVLIPSTASTFNSVEKFTFSSGTLTRVGTTPFIGPSVFTKSISGIVVAD